MLSTSEDHKKALIEAAAARAGSEAEFVRTFYRDVPPAELLSRDPASLSATARSLWAFGAGHRPGTACVRALPRSAESERSVVEIVTDDMPFLVASVTAALARSGLEIHLVIHPIVKDPSGAKVSMMHIELDGDVEEERRSIVTVQLEGVLADVRAAMSAWPSLQQAARDMANAAEAAPATDDAAEAAALLRWLENDNFLFLGYREYAVGAGGPSVVPGASRGLLQNDDLLVFDGLLRAMTSPSVYATVQTPQPLLIAKSNRLSTVSRPVPMDAALLKTFNAEGAVTGLRMLLGLFTIDSHFRPAHEIPLLRQKVRRCQERSGFAPESYNGRALQRILDSFPHDDLFQIDEQHLFDTALAILHLRQRPRLRLFVLRDPFERFATCLVYLPRDRYNAEIKQHVIAILEQALNGRLTTDSTTFDEIGLACLRVVLTSSSRHAPAVDVTEIERQLAEATRSWADRLGESLMRARGRHAAAGLLHRFGAAFPVGYAERYGTDVAVEDIESLEKVIEGEKIALSLSSSGVDLQLKTFHAGEPIALSDILPILENLGVRVITEIPHQVRPPDSATLWIQEFQLQLKSGQSLAAQEGARGLFEDAFRKVWSDTIENDGFNGLVLSAGLSARQIVVLRAYGKVLRQAGSSFSQGYMEDTLNAHPDIARLLLDLFEAQFDPAHHDAGAAQQTTSEITAALEKVENPDEDRILRAYLLLIGKTLRTNFYQRTEAGEPKPYLSLKLASRELDLLPLPRPEVEVFVYSPRMEGCHLRGGKVARGGIRWSDRKEDFRTEILGLMKAQMVKNAVIVPVGSKGGFVLKRPLAGGREALQQEATGCYKYLMAGLLDVTDNLQGDAIVPPPDVVRRDADDPYLVVAADKGTATFSDIANGVAIEYGFWLGDAFASGGSAGYDHKTMGITAQGAWEAVKRHFREMGTDIQRTDFTCVGVGDMSGDVFGNGMLLSKHMKLVAAFNHMHIFIDPDPDPEVSWVERKRLFDLPRSTWQDYDPKLLSKGGAIYARRAKSISLSPEARRTFGIQAGTLSPPQLIQELLRSDVDLLWFGGIGTYVKAMTENDADVGDRANDAVRVDASSLRAKVIGEGANLAVTQRARVEFANRGGRLNTDAIDNSAGVDTSDHEVNIKIGTGDLIAAGLIAAESRAAFLASMTSEVERLVLRDNYLQTLAITLVEAQAPQLLDAHARLMRAMERASRLDRALEFLPDDETIAQRAAAKRGLTRPEIAVLLAYAKNGLYDELLASDLPDQPELRSELLAYFPQGMSRLAPDVLASHRLRREIIATSVANAVVNRMGPNFIEDMKARTGRDVGAIARAYLIVRDVFALEAVWHDIESLDSKVPSAAQMQLLLLVATVVEQAVRWFLLAGLSLEIDTRIRQFQPQVHALASRLADLLPESERQRNEARRISYVEAGAPAELAGRILVLSSLSTAMDIVQVHDETGRDIMELGRLYFGAGTALGLLTIRRQARAMPVATEWQRIVVDGLIDDSYAQQRAVVRRLVGAGVRDAGDGLSDWIGRRAGPGSPVRSVLADIARAPTPDLAMLTVASQRIRAAFT